MGRVTRSHFSRLLYCTGLSVSQDDLQILFQRFEDRTDGRIRYMDFIRSIDVESRNQLMQHTQHTKKIKLLLQQTPILTWSIRTKDQRLESTS
jgi:Ca2+-binding EF-hand superfamily protein